MKLENVKVIPMDPEITRFMGMLIGKNHLGFGNRSWRYMAVINDGVVEAWWQEPGINNDGADDDPSIESNDEKMMHYPETNKQPTAEMNTMVGVDILEQMTTHSTKKETDKNIEW